MREDPYKQFPSGFFSRADESSDASFYEPDRFVTHIDDEAIAAVGALYRELALDGRVLDLMSSWISHFLEPPAELVVLGMNERELQANSSATERVVHDLNVDPTLPFEDGRFDAATCCVSIDYLVRPIDVAIEVSRVVRKGGLFCVTFSNRCFPTKAIRGWLALNDERRCRLVADYLRLARGFDPPTIMSRTQPGRGDPLYAVVATVR
ncbi:MAG: methyltransferase domain-containing protein [Ilumatobacteraceae bacterium]